MNAIRSSRLYFGLPRMTTKGGPSPFSAPLLHGSRKGGQQLRASRGLSRSGSDMRGILLDLVVLALFLQDFGRRGCRQKRQCGLSWAYKTEAVRMSTVQQHGALIRHQALPLIDCQRRLRVAIESLGECGGLTSPNLRNQPCC